LGLQTTDVRESSFLQSSLSPGDEESDEESIVSDVLATEQPSHLRSLFQNDWLSADIGTQDAHVQDRRLKASAHILDIARSTLLKLVPSKEDVYSMGKAAGKWLDLIHTVLAQPFGLNSHQELLDSYDDMVKPDVDTMTLAAWLLDIALTAQQEPKFQGSPATSISLIRRASDFARAVSDAVETTIFSHDRLLGTVPGLGMALHFLRL
jgi:hypothetical protein